MNQLGLIHSSSPTSPAAGNSSVDQSVHELTSQPEKRPINNKPKGSYCHQLQQLLMHLIPFIDLSAVLMYWDSVVIKWSSWANSICLNRWLFWPSLESLQCSLQSSHVQVNWLVYLFSWVSLVLMVNWNHMSTLSTELCKDSSASNK